MYANYKGKRVASFCSAEFLLKALIPWCFTYNPLNLAWIFYYSQGIVRIFYYFQGIVRDLDTSFDEDTYVIFWKRFVP